MGEQIKSMESDRERKLKKEQMEKMFNANVENERMRRKTWEEQKDRVSLQELRDAELANKRLKKLQDEEAERERLRKEKEENERIERERRQKEAEEQRLMMK